MKKVFYHAMIIIMIVTFVAFMYELFTNSTTNAFYLMFLSFISGLMAMTVEPGITEKQQNKVYGVLITVIGLIVITLMMSSCKTSGYGCKGRDSWEKTVRRINRP